MIVASHTSLPLEGKPLIVASHSSLPLEGKVGREAARMRWKLSSIRGHNAHRILRPQNQIRKTGVTIVNCTPFARQYGILLTSGVLFYAERNTKQEIYRRIQAIEGKLINTFPSISAAMASTGAPSIGQCCKRVISSSGGYIWRYADDKL